MLVRSRRYLQADRRNACVSQAYLGAFRFAQVARSTSGLHRAAMDVLRGTTPASTQAWDRPPRAVGAAGLVAAAAATSACRLWTSAGLAATAWRVITARPARSDHAVINGGALCRGEPYVRAWRGATGLRHAGGGAGPPAAQQARSLLRSRPMPSDPGEEWQHVRVLLKKTSALLLEHGGLSFFQELARRLLFTFRRRLSD